MKLPYPIFIALRYLKSKKKHRGISFNTVITTGGVAVGVMALLVVLSVMSGFHEDLRKKILGVNAHVVVLNYTGGIENHEGIIKKLKTIPRVTGASPFVLGQVMVAKGKRAHGVYMRGIDPAYEDQTTSLREHMKEGTLDNLTEDSTLPGIILGSELAGILGAYVGDEINVISPVQEIGPMGMLPRVRKFRVVGLFEVGMYEYDTNLALTSLKAAQEFFRTGDSVTGIELRIDDIYSAPEVRKRVQEILGPPFYARDWMQMNKNLFSALKLEKFTMFVILTLIILVASFNIISTLIMNVIEKEREIAILKAMGATNRAIMAIFIFQGLMIGLAGTTIGVAGGYLLGYLLNTYEIIKLPADVYYLSSIPVKMNLSDFVAVSLSAICISFLATIYPAYQAARLNPVEPLRYE
ncbi:Lipoprotein releasing system transmembrane protein LolC/LolE [hydrothermal vent metagenome]|uniref:Lipoprotein releasing system transmembrane protein LolC/LolE n=1 Tax=hydrothermal vent metagenome TaxID=652676 RepID=A0A3B1DAQ1_9ZZZZ